MLSINDPVNRLHLVGPASEQALNRLGIKNLENLLNYFPRDWQDLTHISPISETRPNESITIKARVKNLAEIRLGRRRMHLTQALLEDESGNVLAIWFNQHYIKNSLITGREYYFSGKAQIYKKSLQLQSPTFELCKTDTIHTAGIIPLYDLTAGITQKQIRYWLKTALDGVVLPPDHLPEDLRRRLSLLPLKNALAEVHFPKSHESLEQARTRLSFDELFLFQLALLSYKKRLKSLSAPAITFDKTLIKNFVSSLPFALTASQRLAAWEILKDLEKPHPMNRLLEGEVGSGKTVVAGLCMLEVAMNGCQSVLLAPTEILAWQHYQTLSDLFKNHKMEVALLTRSRKFSSVITNEKTASHDGNLIDKITNGDIKIIIGTHALLQDQVKFKNIGLLVVDEQHRFGVKQRGQLLGHDDESALVPHLLSMTATPIPRTLALAFYGDLDISQLRQLPTGRKPVITRLVAPQNRAAAYEFVRKKLDIGLQAYVVTPLIEESDKLGAKAATVEAETLKQIFPEFQIGLLHGRLDGSEKQKIINEFKTGKTHMLVTTTVIEVGVDVPNASIMIIENAERFGLSQLHQLRGRVGRGQEQSYCLLFAHDFQDTTRRRLEAVVNSSDGFELAETDLKLRGPGEIIGTKQSGYIPFRMARLSDHKLIKLAKQEAAEFLLVDPKLSKNPLLRERAKRLANTAHLE